MNSAWTRSADEARASHEARVRALEDREVELKKELRGLDEAHAVIRESMGMLSSVAGEAFPAGGGVFEGMHAELSVLAGRATRELYDGEDRARNDLCETRRCMDEAHERYCEVLRALDEEAGGR